MRLNAFLLVDASGAKHPVRWSMVAVDAFAPEPADTPSDKNYLFDALAARVKQAPVQWHLMLTLGQPGDLDQRLDASLAGRSREDRCRHCSR